MCEDLRFFVANITFPIDNKHDICYYYFHSHTIYCYFI